jgi:hypothetical protein
MDRKEKISGFAKGSQTPLKNKRPFFHMTLKLILQNAKEKAAYIL